MMDILELFKICARKVAASFLSGVLFTLMLVLIDGEVLQSQVFVYLAIYVVGISLMVGAPCSILIELVVNRWRGSLRFHGINLLLHLAVSLLIALIFTRQSGNMGDNGLLADFVIGAAGIWLIDTLLTAIPFIRPKKLITRA